MPVAEGVIGPSNLFRTFAVPIDPANAQELIRVQIPQLSFFLVRPDGYIGLCGSRFEPDSFRAYVSQNLHLSI
jgi:hypothetical protein